MIQRYDAQQYAWASLGLMRHSDNGEYVRYTDHLAEIDRLVKALRSVARRSLGARWHPCDKDVIQIDAVLADYPQEGAAE